MNIKKLLGAVVVLAVLGWLINEGYHQPVLALFQSNDAEQSEAELEKCIAAQMRNDRRITYTDARKYCQGPRRKPLLP